MRGFDKYLHQVLRSDPGLAEEYAAAIAELPITTQIAIMRRRQWLTQVEAGRRMGKSQSVVARLERSGSDPRISTIEEFAKTLHCRLVLVPNKRVPRVAAVACR